MAPTFLATAFTPNGLVAMNDITAEIGLLKRQVRDVQSVTSNRILALVGRAAAIFRCPLLGVEQT